MSDEISRKQPKSHVTTARIRSRSGYFRSLLENSGSIQTHGTFSIGMVARNGATDELVNEGSITTAGDLGIGIALSLRSTGFGLATGDTIINRGGVDTHGDGAAGIVVAGDGNHLINSGRITTNGGAFDSADLGVTFRAAGVLVSGNGAVIENTKTGVIESKNTASAAVELNVLQRHGVTDSATSAVLENDGLIRGASVAILGGDGAETVINYGQITGDVVLGGGTDTFIFGSGGRLTGMLFLGGGDDLVDIERGSGSMTIADFAAGPTPKDIIDISAFYSNFADLKAHSYQQGNGVVVGLAGNDRLVLANVKLGALDSGDFKFV